MRLSRALLVWIAAAAAGSLATAAGMAAPKSTHTVNHTVTRTVTKVVYKKQMFPASCLDMPTLASQLEFAGSTIAKTTGQHLDNMTQAGLAVYENNQQKLNAAVSVEYKLKGITDQAVILIIQLHEKLNQEITQCNTDLHR